MIKPKPTVVLVHGAFVESASWSGVVEQLQASAVRAVPGAAHARTGALMESNGAEADCTYW